MPPVPEPADPGPSASAPSASGPSASGPAGTVGPGAADPGAADPRRAVAYGFVVALLIAPFAVFAVGVGSGYAVSATVVVLGVFGVTWAWCAWLLRSGRGPWLFATFLVAVLATAAVIVTA